MRQTGLSMMSLLNVTFFALRSAIRASRYATSNAIVPPAAALGFEFDEIGQRKTAAARQIVFDPPLITPIAVAADRETKLVLVEIARARHVGDGIHGEGDLLKLHALSFRLG